MAIRAAMEVILNEDVSGLGKKNDLIRVRAGYGRNYLFPRGLAVIASSGNRKMVRERLRQSQVRSEKLLSEAQNLAARLSKERIEIRVKINDNGFIFGSVTPLRILKALGEKGFVVPKDSIRLGDAIKQAGEHTITLFLHEQVQPSVVLVVRPEE